MTAPGTESLPSTPPWFAVGRKKFIAMHFGSFGLYSLYWAWCNWKAMHARTGEKFSVALRTIFFGLMSYYLFREIADDLRRLHREATIEPGLLALGLIATGMAARLPDPWWLAAFLSFLVLLPVRAAIDEINQIESPDSATNEEFSGPNIALVCVGGACWLLILLGLLLPSPVAG